MNISPQSLMHALEKVRSGDLSPQQAALQLLQTTDDRVAHLQTTPLHEAFVSASSTPQSVTVAELVAELGTPHPLIQQDWEDQIQELAFQFQQTTGTALAELTTSDLLVDASNRLQLAPRFIQRWSQQATAVLPVAAPERETTTLAEQSCDDPEAKDRIPSESFAPTASHNDSSTKASKRQHSKRSPAAQWKPIASVVGGIALLLLCVWWLGSGKDQEPLAKSSTGDRSNPAATSNAFDFSGNESSRSNSHSAMPDSKLPDSANDEFELATDSESSELLTLSTDDASLQPGNESAATTSGNMSEGSETSDRGMLGLDSFAGGEWQSATDVLKAADSTDDSSEPVVAPEAVPDSDELPEPNVMPKDDALGSEPTTPESEPTEAELATSTRSTSNQVSLPSLIRRSATEESAAIPLPLVPPVQNFSLRTLDDSPLQLLQNNERWLVTSDEVQLAQLFVQDEQIQFQWLTDAFKQPIAKQLCNARLMTQTGNANETSTVDLYLRSTVVAEPLQVGFEQLDNKLAWPIHDLPAMAHARWQTGWHLPPTVTQHWLEPLDETARRRQTAVCRFQSASDESIAIDTRFDWQLGTRIQLRVRHQVASDNPAIRQPISLSRVRSAVEFCTEQMIQGEATLEQLKVASSRARTADRPLISDQRDRLELMMSNWQSYRDRLKQYEKLLNELQKRCYLAASLQIAWDDLPNQPQVIFEIKAPEPIQTATPQAEKSDADSPKPVDAAKKSKSPSM